MKKYRQNPEVIKKLREHAMIPEVKKRANEYYKKYKKLERQINPQFRISCAIRERIRQTFKKQIVTKTNHSIKLLGCSWNHLREHLEQQFQVGMNWKNYGWGWHIDHIKPVSKFDLTKEEEQQECFHYTNLQPLWRLNNLIKSNTYIEE